MIQELFAHSKNEDPSFAQHVTFVYYRLNPPHSAGRGSGRLSAAHTLDDVQLVSNRASRFPILFVATSNSQPYERPQVTNVQPD